MMGYGLNWVEFYTELGEKLVYYRDRQEELVGIIRSLNKEMNTSDVYTEKNIELNITDPFTFYASFNRGISDEKRLIYLERIKDKLNILSELPKKLDGVPLINNMQTRYFHGEKSLKIVDELWNIFINAIKYSKTPDSLNEKKFVEVLNSSTEIKITGRLTMGLFWVAPEFFVSFDGKNTPYLKKKYEIIIHNSLTGEEYVDLNNQIKEILAEENSTIPVLSAEAYSDAGNAWFPKDYSPGFSTEDWVSLLNNPKVFNEYSLKIMKRIKDIGGEATCKQLSTKYGGAINYYNAGSSSLAKRIHKETDCPLLKKDTKNSKWWPILYQGQYTTKKEEGVYKWKLRDELNNALDVVDLSDISLYENDREELADHQYWWISANPKIWKLSDMKEGEEVSYSLYNDKGNKRRIFDNFLNAKIDDNVIFYETQPVKQVVALGKVIKEEDGEKIFFKKLENLSFPIDYFDLKEEPALHDMEYFRNPQGSLFKLTQDEYENIMDIIREYNPMDEEKVYEKYTMDDFLDEVYLSSDKYKKLRYLLLKKGNIILQGPPGVGKTFAAERLAYSILGKKDKDKIGFVQFHQNYSYEDFVMGYKPTEKGFELQNGVFYNFCQKAKKNPEKKFFFIIDEINRGNISKILGELLMLIEYRGKKISLAYDKIPFSVPANLYIIGMMNTADRSLAMMDYALRRRFSFYSMNPGFDSEGFVRYKKTKKNDRFDNLILKIISLNTDIERDASLGKGFKIGHSYFCDLRDGDDEELQAIIDYEILPLLEEYWFDDEEKLKTWESNLKGIFND